MEKVERWTGAFQFREYLDRAGGVPEVDLPPEVPGVYFITGRRWSGPLCDMAESLYVGKAYAAASGGLRGRLGDFVSSLLGFHGPSRLPGGGTTEESRSTCFAETRRGTLWSCFWRGSRCRRRPSSRC